MHWYLKKQDQSIYGPVDLNTLQRWAEDGRIAQGDELSKDQKKWTPPSELKDLHMIWMVELPDGTSYGPVNVLALREPIENGEVTIFCRLTTASGKEETTVGEALMEQLLLKNKDLQEELQNLRQDTTPPTAEKPEKDITDSPSSNINAEDHR